jgi:hypothetical protein
MRRLFCLAAVLTLAAGVTTLSGFGKEPRKENKLMRKKLEHSQKVLEGIALGDFKKIAANAEEPIDISKAAEWKAVRSPRYEVYSNEFRRIADGLVKKANEKNLDGAALAYMELTLTCVRCHKHVREVRMARK